MESAEAQDEQHVWEIMDASIDEILQALSSGRLTSVELVSRYLRRICVYDASGPKLSAVPILNSAVMEEAAASDFLRAAGHSPRPLEGIPFLVKDNIKVQGMTVAAGSPAFEHLVATDDAACVKALRAAGAIVLGRTNMPAMANGGMQRGLYGRAESPYNSEFLTAAYGSGSSNGSATAIAANFAAFSLGTETVSSGRSPASNNALVAYTPSRALLPLSGVWHLYPTCDVLVPYTRTMKDMFHVLDVLAEADNHVEGDFWRQQSFISLPKMSQTRPESFQQLKNEHGLRGKRLGVPSMYIGGPSPVPISIRDSVLKLWKEAKEALESCGAVVIEVDFPLVTDYEPCDVTTDEWARIDNMPRNWLRTERHELIAHIWDDFLVSNGQPNCHSLSCVDPDSIFPLAPGSLQGESEADNRLDWAGLVEYPKTKPYSMSQLPDIKQGLMSLEEARKRTLEDWMKRLNLDAVVFPACGDVGPSNADVDNEASHLAWRNGVLYSNGNLAIRHLGVPTVSIPMGIMEDIKMPINLTFAGKAYNDNILLELGYAFEAATQHRQIPPLVPALDSDIVGRRPAKAESSSGENFTEEELPSLMVTSKIKKREGSMVHIRVKGSVTAPSGRPIPSEFTCYVDGKSHDVNLSDRAWEIDIDRPISDREHCWTRWTNPALVQTIIIVTYRATTGRAAGELIVL